MKSIRTLLALAFVSLFASSAALADDHAKSAEKSACCSAPAEKSCCAEKAACCGSAKKDAKKGQTPSGK